MQMIYIPSKFAKVPLYIFVRSRRSYGKWILQKCLGTTTKVYLKISPKAKERKRNTFVKIYIYDSRTKFSFGLLIYILYYVKRDNHGSINVLNRKKITPFSFNI